MKKLLIATDTFLPALDGATSFLKEIIPRLKDHYKITVLCPDYGKIETKLDAKIIKFKPFNFYLGDRRPVMPKFSVLKQEIKKTDIVWIQGLGLIGLFSIIFSKRYNKPSAMITHIIEWDLFPKAAGKKSLAVPIHVLVKFLATRLYNMTDIIIVTSQEISELLSLLGITTRKRLAHLGIDTKKFTPTKDKEKAKRKLNLDKNDFIIGYVGRLAHEKDLKTIFRAYSRLNKKYPKTKLLIVGEGRSDIKTFLEKKDNVILTGRKVEVVPYYQAMDVHVLASLSETTSLSTLEAMSCGLPVLATPVGYIKEYIKDMNNGILIKKQDSYFLYRKLEFLMQDSQLRKELGENARQTVVNKFSWENTVESILKVFDELTAVPKD
ncbi:glycosyltransferase [Candidatus Woesearchaeota archaeon]|nr:glycosyltransferase [Candidatus Woesearchaeota archaeon]